MYDYGCGDDVRHLYSPALLSQLSATVSRPAAFGGRRNRWVLLTYGALSQAYGLQNPGLSKSC